jgi:hypothetical protein
MKLSFKKINITPSLPVPLSGFGKVRIANKVHDDLYARVFLFDNGKEEILWTQLDLVAIDQYIVDLVLKKTALKAHQVLLSTTHTHSGPGGTLSTHQGMLQGMNPVFCDFNPDYCELITDRIAEAVRELRTQLKESQVRIFKGTIHDLGTERHDASLPCDNDLLIMEFTAEDKKAMIVRAACHPTVLNADNLEVTADFPGAIEPHFSNMDMVAYVNGSCGDMSTRFTRKAQGFDEWARFGQLAADQIKKLITEDVQMQPYTMELNQTFFTVKARETDSLPVALEKLHKAKEAVDAAIRNGVSAQELRVVQSFYEGAQNNLLASKSLADLTEITVPVSALKLNDLTLIFTPCELFSTLSSPLKENGLEFIGYTNGYHLYMADEKAYDRQFYEASSSPYAKGAGEHLMNQIKEWTTK